MSDLASQGSNETKGIKFFKIMFIGDSGVGKTSTLLKMTGDEFSFSGQPTIGVDFRWLTYKMPLRTEPLTLRFWDTAGQERFRSLATAYIRSADAIIVCFDTNEEDSLENLGSWIEEAERIHPSLSNLIIVGCKDDLPVTADLSHSILSRFPWTTVSAKNDTTEDIQKKILPLLHPTFSSLLESWVRVNDQPLVLPQRQSSYGERKRRCC